jgi:DUF1680 family protein
LFPNEEKYVAEIEKSLYNVALANQTKTGQIRYHAKMEGQKEQPDKANNTCCEGQGTRLLGSLPEYIYSIAPDGIYVNLYEPSAMTWNVKDTPVTLTMESEFPKKADLTLKVSTSKPVEMKVRIRIPSWAQEKVSISINDQVAVSNASPGAYVGLTQSWNDGDEIKLSIPMSRTQTQYTGYDKVEGFRRIAFEWGPILLADIGKIDKEHASLTLGGKIPYYEIDQEKFQVYPLVEEVKGEDVKLDESP